MNIRVAVPGNGDVTVVAARKRREKEDEKNAHENTLSRP